jgi:tetratricopeptide (TPR) repeat protein
LLASAALIAPIVATAQQAPTVQADFDAATALDRADDRAGALAIWDRLEARPGLSKRTRAVVRVRKSRALFALGRIDQAVAAARAGLADLPVTDPTLFEDRFQTHLTLGRIGESAIDYATAADEYAKAEALAVTPTDKLSALHGLAATQTFIDPVAAGRALDRADAVMTTAKIGPVVAASFARRRGLVHLNQGDFARAREHSARAVKLMGGLTLRLDSNDVSARNDAALAYLLGGDPERAREYLAYTGAGRMPKGAFDPGTQMTVPDCGAEAGLKPADMAVIEFTVGDDGQVIAATPIYAAGGPKVALEFAREAQGWSWSAEQIATMPKFLRYRARVEMRCSTGFERPSVGALLQTDLDTWLAGKGVPTREVEGSDAANVARQRADLAGAGSDATLTIAALSALLANSAVPREEQQGYAVRALALARAQGAPPTATLTLHLAERTTSVAEGWRDRKYRQLVEPMLSDPAYAADPRARAALRLLVADAETSSRAKALLAQVGGDKALPVADPFRVGALVRLASLEHADGNSVAARAAFESSGLAANQCAIVDKPPKMLRVGGTFPQEAQRWGFEGWTQTQFDVGADGRVLNERTILAYPPFVFSKAGAQTIAGARFDRSFRPDGGLGCGAQKTRVRFQLPN